MPGTFRVVIAGCGGISAAWLDAARAIPGVEVAGLMDIRLEAARKRRDEFQLKKAIAGDDLAAMLKTLKPDALFDCTLPEAHFATTLLALKHGCHVLGEKPMADSLAHAKRMVAAAKRAGRVYAVMQNRRYQKEIRAYRDLLSGGRLGALTTLNCDFYIGAHFGGFRDSMKHVLLLDMAIHTFDAARFISGADPASVFCREWNPRGSWYAHGASAAAVFEMSRGVVFNYRGSWCAEGLNTAWECDWRAICTKGSAAWNGGNVFRAERAAGRGGFISRCEDVPVKVPARSRQGGHKGCIADFFNCLRKGRAPETVCSDNIKSLAMVFGAVESAEAGRTVRIRA